ncbi:MAG: DEAD/DEAH box helicase [Eubacteriales bacterium]|nr:DEAD/DEAH box helicase [Eubacteriales bacterium]
MRKTTALSNLDFIFTPNGFIADTPEHELSAGAMLWKERFDADRYSALYQLGFSENEEWFTFSMQFLFRVSDAFIRSLTRLPELELVRENADVCPDADTIETLLRGLPYTVGTEHVCAAWIEDVFQRLLQIYRAELVNYQGSVEMYLTEKNQNLHVPGRVFFHLVENKDDMYPFAFMTTYATLGEDGMVKHLPLKYALTEYGTNQKKLLELLSCLKKVAESSAFISGFMESGELFHPLRLTAEEAYTFLREIPLYEDAGILCRIPNWWKRKTATVGLSVTIGEKMPSHLGMDAIVSTVPRLMVNGVELTQDEIRALLDQTEGLAFLKGKWIEVDHERLRELLSVCERFEDGSIALIDALRSDIGRLSSDMDEVQVTNGQWLKELRNGMQNPAELEPATTPDSFCARLRPYQHTGFSWLSYMDKLGFGACLADDMGLGKTVQALAFLERLRTQNEGRALLIVPASLLGNWQREIEHFAPEMPYYILHGKSAAALEEECEREEFLTITTYAMAMRLEPLKEFKWSVVLLDEAQAIKNPAAKQTKSIKQLQSRMRIIMTGTPIENNLSNLWSLFDFLNRGLLGTTKEFSAFTKRLASDPGGYAKLREMVAPFILRRLKTDKTVITDLPDKTEISTYVDLSKKQTVLYRSIISGLENSLGDAEGIHRKGLVLAAISKLKQICNHPDQYLGQVLFEPGESGKDQLLKVLCETIDEKRERVLGFTQFREMTEPLAGFLKSIFHRDGLIIHGGIPAKKRTELVDRFQGEDYIPFMVLSIKAGGVGLNLTAANHVIHFDRWWNPAVENQATDRAFRIGQKKDVMVYKFISSGTIEEKINEMINEKSKLAQDIIGAGGETWITELDNSELLKLLRLE